VRTRIDDINECEAITIESTVSFNNGGSGFELQLKNLSLSSAKAFGNSGHGFDIQDTAVNGEISNVESVYNGDESQNNFANFRINDTGNVNLGDNILYACYHMDNPRK
jgi:hypothetical protein